MANLQSGKGKGRNWNHPYSVTNRTLYGIYAPQENAEQERAIAMTAGEIEWMADSWQKRWNHQPTAPKGKEKNWVLTIPGQIWWIYLRFYAPAKVYFDKSWSIGDFKKAT
jgi:hypothetical protein